VLSSRSNF